MHRFFNILLFLFAFSCGLYAQNSPEEYINLSLQAQNQNNYETALSLLNEANRKYSQDANIFFERGVLYFNQRIYQKARQDFLSAEKYGYENTYTLYTNIAEIYGIQGEYEKAKEYYQILIKNYPQNEHAMANALWYFYKTLHIKEGIALGEKAVQTWPDSSSINSMLALLYAGLHNYEKAQAYYQRAVDISIQAGRYREASQTLYNQAIFEGEFYEFALSESLLQKAADLDNNPSSYRLMGELNLKKLLYWPAKDMLEISEELEIKETELIKSNRTPLGRLVLAHLYLVFNQLDMAEKILAEISSLNNQEWISGFGTNKEAYLSWLYNLQTILWEKHYLMLQRSIHGTFWEGIKQKFQAVRAAFFRFYYKSLQDSYTLKGANNMLQEQLYLSAYHNYLILAEGRPAAERRFLDMTTELVLPFAPKAKPTYLAQKALLENNSAWRDQALELFDPIYERYKKQILLEKWLQQNPRTKDRFTLIDRLYQLNRSAVMPYGLPVTIRIQGDKIYTVPLQKLLKQNLHFTDKTPYSLNISMNRGTTEVILQKDGDELLRRTLEYSASRKGLVDLAHRILFYLYFPKE